MSSSMPSFFPLGFSKKEKQVHRAITKLENSEFKKKKKAIKTITEMEGTAYDKILKIKLIECKYKLKEEQKLPRMVKGPKLLKKRS